MSLLKQIAISAVLAAAIQANAAGAATIATITPSAEMPSPDTYSADFNSAVSGAGSMSFDILGYLSLDGAGSGLPQDTFSLILNGVTIFEGSYALGGSGGNATYINNGATVTAVSYGYGLWNGGLLTVSDLAVTLHNGLNSLVFQYSGVAQGLSDEGWSVKGGTVTSAVPGPIAGAGLPALLAMAGFRFYRRRRAAKG